jgi:hypothetical protein
MLARLLKELHPAQKPLLALLGNLGNGNNQWLGLVILLTATQSVAVEDNPGDVYDHLHASEYNIGLLQWIRHLRSRKASGT